MDNNAQISEIVNQLKNGKTLSEISRNILGTNSTAKINSILYKNGIHAWEINERYFYMKEDWLKEKLAQYGSPGAIAKAFNMPRTSISRYAIRYGLYESKFHRKSCNEIDENYFKDIDTSQKAYWLGFIMADGNMYEFKNNGRLQFSLKVARKDSKLIEDFSRDIGFPNDKIRYGASERKGKTNTFTEIRSYNKTFCQNLISHGVVPQKSGKEKIPKEIPFDLKADFIRGFWDGDGHIDLTANIATCVTMSIQMVCDLSSWLNQHKIYSTLSHVYTDSGKLLYYPHIPKYSLKKFFDIVYRPGCYGLPRKIESVRKLYESIQ